MIGMNRVNRFFIQQTKDAKVRADSRKEKFLKRHQKMEVENPNDIWKYSYEKNMTKLAIFVLLYVFSNDDGIISNKEFNDIKKFYKKKKEFLNKEDQIDIYRHVEKTVSYESLVRYLEENDLKESMLDEAIGVVRKMLYNKSVYIKIINDLYKKIH